MSIINGYYIKNMINNKHLSKKRLKWELAIIVTQIYLNNQKDMEKYFYELTIKNIMEDIFVEKIHFFIYGNTDNNNKKRIEELVEKMDTKIIEKINILEIPPFTDPGFFKLSVMQKLIRNGTNTIVIEYGYGFIRQSEYGLSLIDIERNIYTRIMEISNMNVSQTLIIDKFGLNEIIDMNVMIIPYSIESDYYITSSLTLAERIKLNDRHLASSIALTIIYKKTNVTIKNMNNEPFGNNFVSYYNKSTRNLIRELNILGVDTIPRLVLSFDFNSHLFYPYLDIIIDDLESYPMIPNSPLPKIFNTNGFYVKSSIINPYPLIFKRFNDKNEGIYIKKKEGSRMIPQILHHVWLNQDDPDTRYTRAWGKILREPWKYMLWTEKELFSDILDDSNRWSKVYKNEINQETKKVIAYLSILEKYGGLVIDSLTIPTRNIPDDLLMNKFVISFLNEKDFGTKISFRIMASVSGKYQYNVHGIIPSIVNPARRPFEKYIFSKVEQTKKDMINDTNTNTTMVFEDLYRIIVTDNETDKTTMLEKVLLNSPDVTIYPSYYFNPNNYVHPKKTKELTVCICLWPKNVKQDSTKQQRVEPQRSYNVSTKGIMAKLNENPKDRLKTMNLI
jgi:hypothetical protein